MIQEKPSVKTLKTSKLARDVKPLLLPQLDQAIILQRELM
jgi:hypothetical protein